MGDPISPKVTIGIPTFNSEKFLKSTLDSLLCQTYQNIEFTLFDNCSTDRTIEIAQKYQQQFKNFKIISNSENIGGEENFNKILRESHGEIIGIFHSDDVYEPTIVEEYVNLFTKNSNIGAISSLGKVINENNLFSGHTYKLPPHLKGRGHDGFSFNELFEAVLVYGNSFLICPSVLIRREIYQKVGGFDFKLFRSSSDLGLWFKISEVSKFAVIEKNLINYRVHNEQGSNHLVRKALYPPDIIKPVKFFYKRQEQKRFSSLFNFFISFQILRTLKKRIGQDHFGSKKRLLNTSLHFINGIPIYNLLYWKILSVYFLLVADSYLFRGKISKLFKS